MHDPNRYNYPVTVNIYINLVHVHQYEGFTDAQNAYLFIRKRLEEDITNGNEEREPWVCRRFNRVCDLMDENPSRQIIVAENDRLKIGMRYKLH